MRKVRLATLMHGRPCRRHIVAFAAGLVVLLCCAASAEAAGPVVEFSDGIDPVAGPRGITAGPDGNIWFAESDANKIGRITPFGQVTEFSAGLSAHPFVEEITTGPDGNLWFTENTANNIGRITPSGVINEFPIPTANAGPVGIAAGPDGNLWFTERTANKIGRITPAGVITEFSTGLSPVTGLAEIAAGPDGNMWFTESAANQAGRITPTGTITEFSAGPVGTSTSPWGITTGPDANLWIAKLVGNRVAKMTPAGDPTTYPAASASGEPRGIAPGPDGNLWFVKQGGPIARLTLPGGTVNEFQDGFPAGTFSWGVAAGADGNMWFTEGNKVARINTDVPAPTSGNLLRNPGFELAVRPLTAAGVTPVPGWATSATVTTVAYGTAGGWPDASVSAAIAGGTSLLHGGSGTTQSTAVQHVDVSGQSAAIDAGRATARLSAFLGGYASDGDNASVRVAFLSQIATELGSMTIGPVTPADRGNATTLLPRSAAAAVPALTRALRVTVTAKRTQGQSNDGYADNLSLTLDIAAAGGSGGTGTGGGTGGGSGGGIDTVSPVLDDLAASPSRFAVKPAVSGAAKRRRAIPLGTTLKFRLSEAATVTFTFTRKAAGRKSGDRCVAPTRSNKGAKRCTRLVIAGTLTKNGTSGTNRVSFSGRLGRKALSAGSYRLTGTARDAAGNFSRRSASASLTILKK
jgi:streptogramin lyase